MSWYGLKKKPTAEILSVCLLEGWPPSRWFIAAGPDWLQGRDGSPSQSTVLSMASSHTWASMGVRCWLVAEKMLVVCWHTGRQQHLGEGNMQTPAFRKIDSRSTNSSPRPQEYGFYWFVRSVNRRNRVFFYRLLSSSFIHIALLSFCPLNNCHIRPQSSH